MQFPCRAAPRASVRSWGFELGLPVARALPACDPRTGVACTPHGRPHFPTCRKILVGCGRTTCGRSELKLDAQPQPLSFHQGALQSEYPAGVAQHELRPILEPRFSSELQSSRKPKAAQRRTRRMDGSEKLRDRPRVGGSCSVDRLARCQGIRCAGGREPHDARR